MKKVHIILICLLAAACTIGIVTAFAPGAGPISAASGPSVASGQRAASGSSATSGQSATRQAVAKPATTRAAVARPAANANLKAIQAAATKLREDIRKNSLRNERLQLENRSLRIDLRQQLDTVRKTLPPETLNVLKGKRQAIQTLIDGLADTRGDIREITATIPALKTQGAWAGIRDACQRIIAIQDARYETLQQINALLKEMIKLVK